MATVTRCAIVNGQRTPQTGVRGVFYLAVAAGLCEKTHLLVSVCAEGARPPTHGAVMMTFDRIIERRKERSTRTESRRASGGSRDRQHGLRRDPKSHRLECDAWKQP